MQSVLFFFVALSFIAVVRGKNAMHNILAVIGIVGVIVTACLMARG